ncbi:hypothetical protein [Porphyrobacter sp. TH134]|uniref:hypothetical protein n=1 Tax=Porphyrobacter sp. TH134 TaxID=2067450 RepID=UPI00155523AC|nr:hypothetical protein [Porphyrobacter sp. TH134]
MISASARGDMLLQRLRARAARIVAARAAQRRTHQRPDWHSAAALWPDLFGDPGNGK